MGLHASVTASLDALERDARDDAARALALTYAEQIDADPDLLTDLGPRLLAALDALGLTPKARTAITKGGAGAPATNPLDQLRARREHRTGIDGSAPLDAPTA